MAVETFVSPTFFVIHRKTAVLEIALIVMWAIFVGRHYLDFDPHTIPAGREYGSAVQAHHLWTRFEACGICALWDGSERGGFPAFVDPLASSLHPLVIITTLVWGVVNGSKVALIASLAIAGAAQWWLAYELRLGGLARVWGALMVMVGGHLAGRMELGIFSLVLSTSMVSLTFPSALRLWRTSHPRDVALFAVILALVAVSGQGYMQAGFLLISPAYWVLLTAVSPTMPATRLRFGLAAGLALLLAAPFLVPFIHFWPNFVKDTDPAFKAAQPFFSYLLNLFTSDWAYLFSTEGDKLPYPHLYTMFIGVIPVGLALLAGRYGRQEDKRPLLFLAFSAVFAILVGSALPLKWLQPVFPFLAALRFAPMIGGLSIPPLVGLACYSLDRLFHLPWAAPVHTPLVRRMFYWKWWLLFPLLLALLQGYRFSQFWLYSVRLDDDLFRLLAQLQTPTLQWVQPPFGEHVYIEPAVGMGLKLSPGIMTWRWKNRPFPTPVLEATHLPPTLSEHYSGRYQTIFIRTDKDHPYAAVRTADGVEACAATGVGGWIEVRCQTSKVGLLWVAENMWTGWYAWRDGQPMNLTNVHWLQVEAPVGEHVYLFRYLPWDVPLGLLLWAIGCLFCGVLWLTRVK